MEVWGRDGDDVIDVAMEREGAVLDDAQTPQMGGGDR